VCVGVPIKLGHRGTEQIIELNLQPAELRQLQESAQIVKDNFAKLAEFITTK
jgi:malate/lactate dehydrogenase